MAQGILESGYGNSELARYANNHFGIKCHKDWEGDGYYIDDDEINECFRKYKSPEESFSDHSLFLTERKRYADLFLLEVTDYKGWAHGLKKAGYATSPTYANRLIEIIEKYKLYEIDVLVTENYIAHSTTDKPEDDNHQQESNKDLQKNDTSLVLTE
jgi:flagellum-specific peptidoglycan hydrolase FlgJ